MSDVRKTQPLGASSDSTCLIEHVYVKTTTKHHHCTSVPATPMSSTSWTPIYSPYSLFATPPKTSSKASLAGTSLSAATSSAKHSLRRPYHSSPGMGWTIPSGRELEVGRQVAKRSR
jgi:hypothetical protein